MQISYIFILQIVLEATCRSILKSQNLQQNLITIKKTPKDLLY